MCGRRNLQHKTDKVSYPELVKNYLSVRKRQPKGKMGNRPQQTFLRRGHPNGQVPSVFGN